MMDMQYDWEIKLLFYVTKILKFLLQRNLECPDLLECGKALGTLGESEFLCICVCGGA